MNDLKNLAILSLSFLSGILVVAAGAIWVTRDDRPPIQVIAPQVIESENTLASADSVPAGQPAPMLKVHVSGAVARPGVYELREGDRLEDAVVAAGGASEGADLTAINLALRVADERFYYVPKVGEVTPLANLAESDPTDAGPSSSLQPAGPDSTLININDAPLTLLVTLPGIGNVRGQAIIDYRSQNGPFRSTADVTLVSGIGPATYAAIEDLITVGGP